MARKRRPFEVFSMSFLDCMSCGFGAVILFFMIINAQVRETTEDDPSELMAETRKLEVEILEGRKNLVLAKNTIETLDDEKRRQLLALLNKGCSRRTAAIAVGCSPGTITRTAGRKFGNRPRRGDSTGSRRHGSTSDNSMSTIATDTRKNKDAYAALVGGHHGNPEVQLFLTAVVRQGGFKISDKPFNLGKAGVQMNMDVIVFLNLRNQPRQFWLNLIAGHGFIEV